MKDILSVTLNPALDLSTSADAIRPGPKLRCAAPVVEPGGGGINVARVIAALGGKCRAFVALGGSTGAQLETMIEAQGIDVVAFPAPGETRQSFSVTDRQTGEQYRFVLPGEPWDPADIAALADAMVRLVPESGVVVLSGSLPPGVPADFPRTICAAVAARSAQVIVDTSGAALEAMSQGGDTPPAVLRMDSVEAEILAGHPLTGREDTARFAADLVSRGAGRVVLVARGADGSVLAQGHGAWHVAAAKVPVRSKIGAGDSFVGAFALALARGNPLTWALSLGAAAASATVTTDGTELCTLDMVERLLPECRVTPL